MKEEFFLDQFMIYKFEELLNEEEEEFRKWNNECCEMMINIIKYNYPKKGNE